MVSVSPASAATDYQHPLSCIPHSIFAFPFCGLFALRHALSRTTHLPRSPTLSLSQHKRIGIRGYFLDSELPRPRDDHMDKPIPLIYLHRPPLDTIATAVSDLSSSRLNSPQVQVPHSRERFRAASPGCWSMGPDEVSINVEAASAVVTMAVTDRRDRHRHVVVLIRATSATCSVAPPSSLQLHCKGRHCYRRRLCMHRSL
ncbi:hypothetical protein CC85DRAFT_201437 [Cutaneotrichosporon oleaginosum]|uniref:Uncharacterized protein n=1 Tax=Cutaneotrichosporon oleaginosum TaxID=879819 RepID=A0A0J0XU98_9TREE|nr:uncharacterized protein CC85DRAFT_201437 [Cutaneotrichosporon oleaginosum]KLT44663.1 hypothetical protein CC85DRAFT_201437 [Cutaneotrichosporon oleaginosum]TXT07650.1 hypothetical protein COLE_04574 [Cutaneotrichosporon oleaginosum]